MSKKDSIFSPPGIFIIYILASFLLILGFRFIFPGQPAPLRIFSFFWRFIRGVLTFIGLFPALALSSLVIPFGLKSEYYQVSFARFSPRFLAVLRASIITAIGAATAYGLLFFLALPLVQGAQADMRYKGQLFRLARDKAEAHAAETAWPEAARFMAVCDRIWPGSPETASLRVKISIGYEEYQNSLDVPAETPDRGPAYSGIPGKQNPVDAAEAIALANRALGEERFYDAHWLASLAGRLARAGSVEAAEAGRLAGLAWNAVSSLEPKARETQIYTLYHQKRSGYEAMVSEDWIRGYYIFNDLAEKTPEDPDVFNYLRICERGVSTVAFFTDEMDAAMGDVLTGAVFSLPGSGETGGAARMVMRLASLSAFPDFSFAAGMELIAFNGAKEVLYRIEAPYVKVLPFTLESKPRLLILMRALDRRDERIRWDPAWTGPGRTGNTQLIVDLDYDRWLLLSRIPQGMDNLLMGELLAAGSLENYGYIPEVFQAEALRRFTEPVLFLSIAILGIVIGWRYRAKKRPRYMGPPMLLILPLVFNGLMHLCRSLFNSLGILAVVSLGFSTALPIFAAAAALCFILTLIVLAAQHG